MTPTPEQQAIVEAYSASKNLVIEAGAGTGKTSTLRMTAAAKPKRRATYIAYNRAIADDARRSFPPNVQCATAHSLAFRAVGRQFRHRLNGPRMPARVTAKLLRIDPLRVSDDVVLTAQQVARLVTDTVARFCYSADPDPHGGHVPALPGANSPAARAVLREAVVPLARKAWADLSHPNGELKFTHDCYLKLWQLSGPVLDADTVFLDEAQDANPLIADIVERQTHAQRVLVGDRCQAIYGWRGAIDAMRDFKADARLALSQSFRFGEPIATEANKWLQILKAPLRLRGADHVHSTVGPLGAADAVLCRTNAEAVSQLMSAAGNGRRVALVGGGAEIRRLAEAAIDLQAGRPADQPPGADGLHELGDGQGVRRPGGDRLGPQGVRAAHRPARPRGDHRHHRPAGRRALRQSGRVHRPQGQGPRMAPCPDRAGLPRAQGRERHHRAGGRDAGLRRGHQSTPRPGPRRARLG